MERAQQPGTAGLFDSESLMISRQDERLFRQAVVVAAAGQPHVRVGAVLSQGRKPYVWECNVSGPNHGEPFHAGHAEIRALRKVRDGSTLYIARIDRAGTVMPSHPCAGCHAEIVASGQVKKIVYFNGKSLVKVRI